MAVDFGDARTGLAVCDKTEFLASPVGVIHEKDFDTTVQKVAYAGRGLNLFTFACCLSHLQRIPVCRCLTLVY